MIRPVPAIVNFNDTYGIVIAMSDELAPDLQYELACAGPELDRVEAALRAAGQQKLADDLFKLQQDTGLEGAGEISPDDGPQTASLIDNYQGNTAARTAHVLRACHARLNDAELKNWLAGFMQTLNISLASNSSPSARPAP